jgi:monooxygenase
METMGYTFKPWDGDKSLASGPSILEYIHTCTNEYDLKKHIRCGHTVTSTNFNSTDARWTIDVDVTDSDAPAARSPKSRRDPSPKRARSPSPKATATRGRGARSAAASPSVSPKRSPSPSARSKAAKVKALAPRKVRYTCSFILLCTGYYDYSEGYTPEFKGRESFKGTIIHPQFWPKDLDYTGKRVVVVGSGATAITLVPSLVDKAAHVTMLQRSPTYIASLPGKDPVIHLMRSTLPRFLADIGARWWGILFAVWAYWFSMAFPGVMKWCLVSLAQKDLRKDNAYMQKHFSPRYGPWEQRLCVVPDADFFCAVRQGKASVVTSPTKAFCPEGILVEDPSGNEGKELVPADIIITATGLKLKLVGGIKVFVDGTEVDVTKHLMYKGVMLSNLPNAAVSIGYTNNTWTLKCDLTFGYVTALLNYMDSNGYNTVVPYKAASKRPDGEPSHAASRGESIFNLSASYVTRALHLMPRQGDEYPWVYNHNYLQDMHALRFTHLLDDEVLQFK